MIKLYVSVKVKLYNIMHDKKSGDDKLVVSLVLIAVGVVLCFLYRDKVKDVLTTALSTLTDKLKDMFDTSSPVSG